MAPDGNRLIASGLVRPRLWAAVAAVLGLVVSGKHTPIIVYNATASAPVGFYRVRAPAAITIGDIVLVQTPESVRAMAAQRGYIPSSVPLVKRVAGLPGQNVCAVGRGVTIDERWVADRLPSDREGRELPGWTGCRTLANGELFILTADVPDSFDSRYFGPVSEKATIGRLSPLWLR